MNSLNFKWPNKQGFDAMPICDNLWKEDFFLFDIKKQFDGVSVFLRMNAFQLYNWHTDLYRNVVINSVIEGFDSFTMFTDKDPNDFSGTSMPIRELTYKAGDCYLLNTSVHHAVYNRNNRRTFFSLYFKPKVRYEDVYNYALKKDYILQS